MIPKKEWIQQWIQHRDELYSSVDLERYFVQGEVNGQQVEVVRIGLCSVPTGELMARDPIFCLENRKELPYFINAPVGNYPVELALVRPDGEEPLFVAARVRFNYRTAVRFEQALIGTEEIADYDGGFFGFFSYSGLGCICDRKVHQAFCNFLEKWRRDHPEGELFEDYFAPLLEKSPHAWLNWVIPGTEHHLPIFPTGWGEGQYPVYWGRDAEGGVCQLVIWMIDLDKKDEEEPSDELEEEILEPDTDQEQLELPALLEAKGGYRCRLFLDNWHQFFEDDQQLPVLFTARSQALEPEDCQKAMQNLVEHQYGILDEMMLSLEDKYPIMQLEYGHPMAENAPEMPNLRDRNDFSELLRPLRLMVDVDTGTVSAAFRCRWDEKYGLGISVCGEQLVQIGTMQLVPEFEQQQETTEQLAAAQEHRRTKPLGRRKKKQYKKREQKKMVSQQMAVSNAAKRHL